MKEETAGVKLLFNDTPLSRQQLSSPSFWKLYYTWSLASSAWILSERRLKVWKDSHLHVQDRLARINLRKTIPTLSSLLRRDVVSFYQLMRFIIWIEDSNLQVQKHCLRDDINFKIRITTRTRCVTMLKCPLQLYHGIWSTDVILHKFH
jgi:hypothetical protein